MALSIRWNIGDVSTRGFDALACSIRGVRGIFGDAARYIVCVNNVDLDKAKTLVAAVADEVEWHDSSGDLPVWMRRYLPSNMAEGVAWKFAPPRLFPDDYSLALDNDVVLWSMPDAIAGWLADGDSLLIAEDVRACFGQFANMCPAAPRNSGIVGVPPGFDLEGNLRSLVECCGAQLVSEMDEQGLQAALVTREKHRVVPVDEVSICGYYRPHRLELGCCGAHFVGVNRKDAAHAHGIWDWKRPEIEECLALNGRGRAVQRAGE